MYAIYTQKIMVRVSKDVMRALKKHSKEKKETVSKIVRDIISEYVKKK